MSTIWIDADAVPRAIKEVLFKASLKRQVKLIFVANSWLQLPKNHLIQLVKVSKGADVADDHIANSCKAGDLVITADIPLAARVIDNGAAALRPRGELLDEGNIKEKKSFRDFSTELRDLGMDTGGAPPFHKKDKQKFSNALDRWLTRNGY